MNLATTLDISQLPDPQAVAGHASASEPIEAIRLAELRRHAENDGLELLKKRFLCRRGGMLVVGPTGIGKSSLTMQMMVAWSQGQPAFGIVPTRPLKSLVIQAENDEGDLAEMREGVTRGLGINPGDCEIFFNQEVCRTGQAFFDLTVRPLLEKYRPDLLWIDPANAYVGGDVKAQEVVGAFLRNGLNPLLHEFNCAGVVVHHTNKPPTGKEKVDWQAGDLAYLGSGSLYGRRIDTGDKRHFFLPGRNTGLWNAVALKTHAHIILVESVIDGLSVELAGNLNVVAIQGTNGMDENDVETLRQYGVQRVTLLLDGDDPGRTGAQRLATVLSSFNCNVLSLPDGEDPNSYLQKHGAPGLAAFIAGTKPTTPKPPVTATPDAPQGETGARSIPGGIAVQIGLRRYELRGLEKGPRKLKATVRVEHAGRLHVDTLDLYSARWRRQLAQDLVRIFEESADVIEGDIVKLMTMAEASGLGPETASPECPVVTMTPEARAEAETLGRSPDLIKTILDDYEKCGLVGERANKLLAYVAMTSRKMEKPLAVMILSSSGAGKTALQDMALSLCPPEDLVKLTSLSGKALFYKEGNSLKNKVLALEEGDGVEEAMYALRNLISAGELVSESTIKDPATGRLTTMENRVEGPTAVFLTTTKPDGDPETKSRFFITSIDESKAQTQAILAYQRRRHTLAGLAEKMASGPIQQKHRNFQRLLRPYQVVNRYADQLSYGDDRLQGRRDQPKYLGLIAAVALLRQMQKEPKPANGNGTLYIEVDKDDIRLANEMATEIMGHSLDELSRPASDLLRLLVDMGKPADTAKEKKPDLPPSAGPRHPPAFTRRQIREHSGWSNARVHRYLQELIEFEFVLVEHGRNGVMHRYRLCYDGEGQDGSKFLLGLKPADQLQEPA